MFLVASTYLCMLPRHSNLLYSRCLLSLARTITWVIGPTSTAENVTKTYLPVTNIGMLWPAFAGDALAQDHSLSACLLDNLARYVRLASRLVSILLDQAMHHIHGVHVAVSGSAVQDAQRSRSDDGSSNRV